VYIYLCHSLLLNMIFPIQYSALYRATIRIALPILAVRASKGFVELDLPPFCFLLKGRVHIPGQLRLLLGNAKLQVGAG